MKDPFAPQAALRLKPVDVPGMPAPVDLRRPAEGEPRLTVGRAEDNDLAFTDGQFPSVSSHHCRFEMRGDALWVEDLGSRNGVLVNGEAIQGERALALGDQVRLGSVGPKLLVVGSRSLDETVFVHHEDVLAGTEQVQTIVRKGGQRTMLRVVALLIVLGSVLAWYFVEQNKKRQDLEGRLTTRGEAYEAKLQQQRDEISALQQREMTRDKEVKADAEQRAARILDLEKQVAARATELEATMQTRLKDEERLAARIADLEVDGGSRELLARLERDLAGARKDLDTTRAELVDARRRVDLFDPVNLAQNRLSGVAAVRRSVVLIENRTRIRNTDSGDTLFLRGFGENAEPNFQGLGEEFAIESTGSGFCIHPDGWFVTNAHVIEKPKSDLLDAISQPDFLDQEQDLAVVFSGDSVRHPAKVYRLAPNGVDLALIKIDPFEGMPTLTAFTPDVVAPLPGSDIYLFGFPLGHLAVQEGETVIASTFRGILSRNVGGQMQVDAGVHPGNSGGPITDSAGRVIGVVVSVQALPDRTAVYTIGYGIPIADVGLIWPPDLVAEPGEGQPAGTPLDAGATQPADGR